jgi:hypothetical protein
VNGNLESPILFSVRPTKDDIASVVSITRQPTDCSTIVDNSNTVSIPCGIAINWRAVIFFAITVPILGTIASWALPSVPRPAVEIVILLIFAAAASLLSALFTTKRPTPMLAIIDRSDNSITLPPYQTTLNSSDILCFTQYTDRYRGAEELTQATQFGVVVKMKDSNEFAFYEMATIDALDFRRILRKQYDIENWRYVRDETTGTPRLLTDPGT